MLYNTRIRNVIVPINSTGYGVAGTAIAKTFITERIQANVVAPLRVVCIGNPSFETKEDENIITPYLSKEPFEEVSSFVFWHAGHLDSINVPNRGGSIAYTTFELESLSNKEIENLNKFKCTATTTKHHAKIISTKVGSKCYIIPHGSSDLGLKYTPELNLCKIWGDKLGTFFKPDTLFLSSIGKYEKRKGFYKLLDIGLYSKYPGPTVILASWHNPFFSFPFDELHVRGFKQIPSNRYTVYSLNNLKVVLLSPTQTRKELIQRAMLSHAFISVSHGEGWNLPLAEMYETGIPIISSLEHVLDYIQIGEAIYRIPKEAHALIKADDRVFFHGERDWFDFSLNSITDQINLVYRTVLDGTCKYYIGINRALLGWADSLHVEWNSN